MTAPRVTGQFHFTDDQWRAIVEPLGCATIDPDVKTQLQDIAARFHRQNLHPLRMSSKEDKKGNAAVSKQAKVLREKLDRVESYGVFYRAAMWTDVTIIGADDPDDQIDVWDLFERALGSLIKRSERLAHAPRPPPANVPFARNRAWKAALGIFEQVTGKRATVKEHVDFGVGRKPPSGRFVQFIQAFTAAFSGKKPSSDQVREWLRKHRKTATPARRAKVSNI
jgi:hypothetical protein